MKIFNSIIFILLSLSVFGQKSGFTLATPTQPTVIGCDTLTNTPIQIELGKIMCCFEVIDGQTFKRDNCDNVVLGSCSEPIKTLYTEELCFQGYFYWYDNTTPSNGACGLVSANYGLAPNETTWISFENSCDNYDPFAGNVNTAANLNGYFDDMNNYLTANTSSEWVWGLNVDDKCWRYFSTISKSQCYGLWTLDYNGKVVTVEPRIDYQRCQITKKVCEYKDENDQPVIESFYYDLNDDLITDLPQYIIDCTGWDAVVVNKIYPDNESVEECLTVDCTYIGIEEIDNPCDVGTEFICADSDGSGISLTLNWSICDGVYSQEIYETASLQLDPTEWIVYEGDFANCDGTPFEEPTPECDEIISAETKCYLQSTEGQPIKLASSSSDCDPGSAEVGVEICRPLQVSLDGVPVSPVSETTTNPDVTVSFVSIDGNSANYEYCYINDGVTSPSGDISIEMTTDKGNVVWNTADNSDFRLCADGGGSYTGTTKGESLEVEIKVICKYNCPDEYWIGEEQVDISLYEECDNDSDCTPTTISQCALVVDPENEKGRIKTEIWKTTCETWVDCDGMEFTEFTKIDCDCDYSYINTTVCATSQAGCTELDRVIEKFSNCDEVFSNGEQTLITDYNLNGQVVPTPEGEIVPCNSCDDLCEQVCFLCDTETSVPTIDATATQIKVQIKQVAIKLTAVKTLTKRTLTQEKEIVTLERELAELREKAISVKPSEFICKDGDQLNTKICNGIAYDLESGAVVDTTGYLRLPTCEVEVCIPDMTVKVVGLPKEICEDECFESAIRLTTGRPNGNTIVTYGPYTLPFSEFAIVWEENEGSEYVTNQNGTGDGTGSNEAHWICPAKYGNVILFDGVPIENPLTISPNEYASQLDYESREVLSTVGWYDKQILEAIEDLEEFELKYVCVIEEGTPNGIIGQRWTNFDDDDTNNVGAADHLPNDQVFINGQHINGDPTFTTTITDNWNLDDRDFGTVTLPDVHSQEKFCAYLNITQDMKFRDTNLNHGEYLTVLIEDCNKDMVPIANLFTNGKNASLGEFHTGCEGIRKIEIQINDFSWYGGFNLQYSTDGGLTWSAFPMSETYAYSPKINEVCLKVDADGNQFNLDGTPFTGKLIKCDAPCYPMSRNPVDDIEVIVETACFDDDGVVGNDISVTQEIIFTNGEQTSLVFYENYGADNQSEIPIDGYVFVNCLNGEPIDEPVVPVNCEQAYKALAFAPIGDNGVNFEFWNDLDQTYTAQQQAADIFDGVVDYSGMPAINSNEGLPETRKEADLFIRDPDITQNAYRYWTYLYTTVPIRLREFHPTAESAVYYIGECQASPTLAATGTYLNNTLPPALDVSLSAGIHYIGGEVYDFSAWGYTRFQYSIDGGTTWLNVPPSWLYCSEPTLSECQVQVCTKPSGIKVLTDIETCLPLGSEYTLKKPSLCSGEVATEREPTCVLETFYKINYPEAGTVEQQWTTSAVAMSGAAGTSYNSAFTVTDSEGYPSIAATADATTTQTTATTTNFSGLHQAQSDFYIFPTEPFNLSEFNPTAETSGVWISEQCGSETMVEVLDATYTNTTNNSIGYYQPGCYRVRLYCADLSANGVTRLRANDGNITAYPTKPTVEIVKEWVCSDQNVNEFAEANGLLCEDPRCSPSGSSSCNIKIVD